MDIDWAIEIYFPEEIIVEILIKLPVQSLLRFKCTSKFWKTLITSDHFKAKHYNHAKNNKKILITRWHPDHTTSYYGSSLSSPQPLQKLGCCPSNNKPNMYEVLCCCDGLSLLHFYYDYLLWNPSTNESIQLPYIDYQESIRSTFGLEYDSISDDYKILKIDNNGGDDSRPPSKILALKSGSWRKIDNHPRIFHNSTYRDNPLTFVCGAFHWLSKDNVNKYFMISLNISSEVYKEIPLPEGICNIPNMAFIKRDVSVIEGMLCAYCSCLQAGAAGDTFKLWVMKDYASIRSGPNHVNRQKKSYSPYSYDPHVTCDHCKRKGHTKAIYFRLVGYLPDFERRRRENQLNNYSDKGSNYLDKGNYYSERGGNTHTAHNAAHNVVNNPVKYQEHTTHFSGNMDYNKGMEVIHEQYNQILHMLGKTNLQGTSDMTTSSQGPINDSANSIQSSNTAGNSLKLTQLLLSCCGIKDWDTPHQMF
ncbi:hypothetical protein H5410_038913 [Solanum commersonii]|uniref:F-box domain-containing protein n=1 Tax=Solanum commersonii TaxID=4109 RepID=A0A9J5YBG7_SOLCO|nr:hypothetical protein H5410_038913 [Solanum commersonii]